MALLQSRVYKKVDINLPKDTTYVFPRRKEVQEYNTSGINDLLGEEKLISARNIFPNTADF